MAVSIAFTEKAERDYKKLIEDTNKQISDGINNSFEQKLLKSINQKIEILKLDHHYGNQVPKVILKNSSFSFADNLWVVDLIGYWRMLYMLDGPKIKVVCFILEICDHGKYNKIFGYKKK